MQASTGANKSTNMVLRHAALKLAVTEHTTETASPQIRVPTASDDVQIDKAVLNKEW
jgi:hypothetical protein